MLCGTRDMCGCVPDVVVRPGAVCGPIKQQECFNNVFIVSGGHRNNQKGCDMTVKSCIMTLADLTHGDR